jgi:hypothetical protein
MQDRCPGYPCRIVQSRRKNPFDVIQYPGDIGIRGLILRRPGNDAGAVAMHEVQVIGDLGHQLRITPQYGDFGPVQTLMVLVREQIRDRAVRTAGAVIQELDVHASRIS